MNVSDSSLTLGTDERFDRLESIQWWDQSLLARARVLVVGAGALGNEVVKNLSLLGVGNLVVVDKDRVERSNLCRSVLFRESDEGKPKADCAVRAARSIYPRIHACAVNANLVADFGLGYFRWAHVIVGAVDNREARVFINQTCARMGKPWIDGGIDVFQGVVRGFAPPKTSCYECTMSQVDWDMLNRRRSCSLLARRVASQGGTPTTPITASVIGALGAQEVVKVIHRMEALMGCGYVFDGATYDSYPIKYPINPECPWHTDEPCRVETADDLTCESPLETVWRRAAEQIGGLDAIDLGRELVDTTLCPSCGRQQRLLAPAENLTEDQIVCEQCGTECVPTFLHSIYGDSDLLDRPLRDIGIPNWDVLWCRSGDTYVGIEVAGDRPSDLAVGDEPAQTKSADGENARAPI